MRRTAWLPGYGPLTCERNRGQFFGISPRGVPWIDPITMSGYFLRWIGDRWTWVGTSVLF